ncbi:MAG: sensor N-terminal transmembrane domain-containing protein, partial [Brevundimonas sp.]
MASATDTARADPEGDGDLARRPLQLAGSRLGGLILALNLLSLLILLVGALLLNEWRRNLIDARLDSLTAQAELLANVLGEA